MVVPRKSPSLSHSRSIRWFSSLPTFSSFSAWQQAVRELAWIVDVPALEAELDAALRYAPHVTRVEQPVDAALAVLAEGRASATREALGVAFETQDYGQRAIAARLVSDVPHAGLARQWFRSPDVLALLPLDRPQPGAGETQGVAHREVQRPDGDDPPARRGQPVGDPGLVAGPDGGQEQGRPPGAADAVVGRQQGRGTPGLVLQHQVHPGR